MINLVSGQWQKAEIFPHLPHHPHIPHLPSPQSLPKTNICPFAGVN
ncbi:hypothetical protein Aazo_0327 ['Nostoc azollae' 0708]|jgi:hypothetical protein|uniref:Uncharacterized protein n=1 Tax=Nostoc azollae (strain 0708) TaxID=551115 RepID=D7DZF8_NOSA0|nr:hypothetical protein Aazo_0327 ['Nostoc azollae' 0708]